MSFESLGLNPDLLRALSDLNHNSPTPIQRQTIPPIIEGRDVLGVAQTGSGKTGGFLLPSLHRNKRAQGTRVRHQILVLSPTRELAGQIERSAREYGKSRGGRGFEGPQRKNLLRQKVGWKERGWNDRRNGEKGRLIPGGGNRKGAGSGPLQVI